MLISYKRLLIAVAVFIVLLGLGLLAGVQYWKQLLSQPLNNQEDVVYELKAGLGANQVLRQLKKESLLDSTGPLKIWLRLNPDKSLLKAGEYNIPAGINSYELMALLASGQSIQYQITLPEGWSFAQALAKLQIHPKLAIKTAEMTSHEIMQQVTGIEETNLHPEGMFFPDTYQFHKGISDLQLLKQAYQRMQKVMADEWQKANVGKLPYKSAYDALIMASIVEKETGVPHERGRIAGVFVLRLEKKMRLQTDPTVIYGLGDEFKGNITRKHLRQKTPYNTYRIKGLPPTPIALPGREAIHAALNPEKDGSLYFVAKGDGSHEFNRTLAGHNRAVRKFQIYKRKRNYQSAPQSSQASQ